MKLTKFARLRRGTWLALCGLLMGAWGLQSCSDDVLTGQPSWLGNSIYERLQEDGNYQNTLKLIDDLGLHDVLSQTGSKTLFAADDAAFDEWFKTNTWGVRSYSQLSTAQKKMLLNNSMVNNAYLVELLSNVSATPPLEGMCMRRATASSIYDSVAIVRPEQMPDTKAWARFKQNGRSIPLFKDATEAPMIHFLPAWMKEYKITDEDLAILTNGVATSTAEAWVDGKQIVERDITCKNGYIQKVNGVIESAPNMAEILRQHAVTSEWSRLIDRFSAPYYNNEGTKEYNRLYNNEDSVFTLRYFSETAIGGQTNRRNPDGELVDATLKFDPGWNQYMYTNTSGYDLHYDCGAMLVPTNEALDSWWNAGGRVLQDEYGTWDNVPDLVLSELLNNNMIATFSETVPSKFDNILNDAMVTMGVKPEHVDSCFMGCNGVVYLVNRVFAPTSYASVSFPALIHQSTMSVIYWALRSNPNGDFGPYLNSMDSYYSLILPSNNAMMYYIDPVNYGKVNQTLLQFYYDDETKAVMADRYDCTINEDGEVEIGALVTPNISTSSTNTVIANRLEDMVNQLIIVGNVEDGHEYYKTKGGSLVRVTNAGVENSMTFAGGWQMEQNKPLTVTTIYDQSATGNGKSYVVDGQTVLGAQKSVYMTLRENPEYEEFFKLLSGGDPDSTSQNLLISSMNNGSYLCANSDENYNMRLFDNYNYTVYVPTNDVIIDLHNRGYLPSWDDFEEQDSIATDDRSTDSQKQEAEMYKYIIKNRINNFVRYHIQDNSVAIGMAPELDAEGNVPDTVNFESSKRNPSNGRFYSLVVNFDDSQLTVTDQLGNPRHVVKTPGLYNNICREYWFKADSHSKKVDVNSDLYMKSDAVIHQIDGALFYDQQQLTPWTNDFKRERRK